jgi:AcrR family transcriptional regulator
LVRKLNPTRKEDLLRSALKLFVAKGVQNTSTAEIAREAGVAAGTLFLYFPKKQDLVDTLILRAGREQSERVKAQLLPPLDGRESFLTIWRGTVQWFLENMEAYQYVQQTRESGVVSAAAVMESYKFFDYYYAAIQKALAEGSIKPYPPEIIGDFLYYDLVAVMSLVRAAPAPARQAEIVQLGFDIFWDGIKK